MNTIMVIKPYRHAGTWVFDDEATGLVKEAFVCGTDIIIDKMVEEFGIKNAHNGFTLIFSGTKFPTAKTRIEHMPWVDTGGVGNWYWSDRYKMGGWLCPALFKYFDKAPKQIWVEPKELNEKGE